MGGGHLDPEIRGGGPGLKKNFSRSFEPQFGLKIRGEGRPPRAPPLDPPLMPLCFSPIPYVSFGTEIANEIKTQATVIATVTHD